MCTSQVGALYCEVYATLSCGTSKAKGVHFTVWLIWHQLAAAHLIIKISFC